MKIKKGYIMKKLAGGYVVVTVGEASKDFNGLIRFNQTGAVIWDAILNGADTKEKIVEAMLAAYEDLDAKTASAEADRFLEAIPFALED